MVMPHLPVELAGESAKQRIAHLVTSLPATSGCGFEVRLGNQADQVDFCLRAMASEGGREAFSEYEPVAASPPANQAKWHALREFCLHWCDPSSPILDHVNNVWLEFDLDQSAFRGQAPSFFLTSAKMPFLKVNGLLRKHCPSFAPCPRISKRSKRYTAVCLLCQQGPVSIILAPCWRGRSSLCGYA